MFWPSNNSKKLILLRFYSQIKILLDSTQACFGGNPSYLLANLCKIIKPLTLKVTDSHSTPHSWNVYSWLIWIGSDNGVTGPSFLSPNIIWALVPCCHSSLAMTSLWPVMKRLVISLIKYWYVYRHKSNFNQQTQTNANDGSVGPFTN